mgnify:CR=1 FL=1
MITKVGIFVFHGFAFMAFFAGVFTLLDAASIPGNYRLYNASAVQITQVYSEATFEVMKAIGYLLVATFIEIALYVGYPRTDTNIETVKKTTETTKQMVAKIGGMIQKAR